MFRRVVTAAVACALVVLGVPFGTGRADAAGTTNGTFALTTIGATYTQDFNGLSNSVASSALPMGWALDEVGTSSANNGLYAVGTGSGNGGDTYSFGSTGSTDRAFGTLFSGSLTSTIGANFRNDTGRPITGLDISYAGEQWRLGAVSRGPDRLDFQYSLNATSVASTTATWVDADSLDFVSPRYCPTASCPGIAAGLLDGNLAVNRLVIAATISVNIPAGATLWIRWKEFDAAPGADDGLAVDDFSLTPRALDAAPTVVSTTPANGATNIPVNTTISIGFSEPVTLASGWYAISCGTTFTHLATESSGGPNVYILTPTTSFGSSETCTVTVDATKVSDNDGIPPANMAANYSFSFTTAAPTDAAPSVVFISPLNGATNVARDSTVTIGFSEPVTLGGGWYAISCSLSGIHGATQSTGGVPNVYILDAAADFAYSETCTVTVDATKVSDNDGLPPSNMTTNFSFNFTTAGNVCLDPATAIHTVQGSALTSPIAGTTVTVQGVVVGDLQQTPQQFGGFYVEEEDADWDMDPATSEGIFVLSTLAVSAGDVVRVTGTVAELVSGTASLTELTSVSAVIVCSSGASVTPTEVVLPVASMADFERYEGMLVHFSQTLTATETFTLGRFGEVRLAAGGRLYTPTAVVAPGLTAAAKEDENQRRSFVLDDGNNQQNIDPTINPAGGLSASNTLRSGYTVTGLTGVFDQRFSSYRLQPFAGVAFAPANPRSSAPTGTGNLKIASFNVLNFFNGNGQGGGFPTARGANTLTEYGRQKAKEVSALQQMNADIVGLMEMENDATPFSAIEDLVAGLNLAMGAGTYSFIDTGVIGTDAIRVALIYKPATVTPVGAYAILTTEVDRRFVDTKNRPSLAQTFRLTNGAKLTVVVNHLKSKGSDCNDLADPDTGDGQGNCNVTRRNAAAALVDWLATDPTGSRDPDFLLIGDMNSYTFEDPITTFTGHGFTNLVRQYGGLEAYSYVFGGQSGYLDHGLATSSLAAQVTKAVDWHINSDEPTVLDYNTEFKSTTQVNTFYDAGPYRASDHDPVLVFMQLVDSVAPQITMPADLAVLTGAIATSCGTIVSDTVLGIATATDDSGLAPAITRSGLPAGNVFPVGRTAITYTATDASGNSATATQLVTIVDNAPPMVSAPADVNAGTGPGATAPAVLISDTVLGTATASDNCPDLQIARSGVPAANVFPLGVTTITYTATDQSGNTATATQSVTVVDDTAPTISGAVTTTPNANGWYATSVTVHFTCADNVAYISCEPDRTLSTDGIGQSVTGSAADAAGNTASATVAGINIDRTAPTITGTTPGYTLGTWTNTDVSVVFTCADTLSGVATCAAPVTVTAEGAALQVSGTTADSAGNSAFATVGPIRIDKTAPQITPPAAVTTSTGAAATACGTIVTDAALGIATATDNSGLAPTVSRSGVPAGNVFPVGTTVLTYTATDAAGNIATTTQRVTVTDDTPPSINAPSAVIAGTGPGATTATQLISDAALGSATASDNCPDLQIARSGVPVGNVFPLGVTTITYTATDQSGNASTATQSVTVVDDTAPTISGAATTTPNANGWYATSVTVHFTCADNVAVVSCEPDRTLSTDGLGQSVTGTVADAGNTASATVAGINIDRTAPNITGTTPGYTLGAWTNTDVSVVFTCADTLSGVATCAAPVTLSTEGDGQQVSGAAADLAGNTTSTTVQTIRIDKTAPLIVLSGPLSYTVDQTLAITCTASDALSGVVVASCPGLSGPAVAAGIGSHTFTSGSTDRAGNAGSATVTYTVSVTYTSLCALTRTYTTGAGIANSLCKKLDAAAAAATRGNATNNIDAYIHEVEAQRGKAIDTTDAGIIIALARGL